MIKFKSIEIEGFGSFIKPFVYYLDSPGINLITGKNGSGKTTIFSALVWGLYGQTLKGKADITPWPDIQKDFIGTKVEVKFLVSNTQIKVIRCKDYSGKILSKAGGNKLFLFIGDKLQPIRDKREVQTKIIELLGMSLNLFKNSIAFGQNLTRLLKESGPRQKEIFDEAFDVTYINSAREKAVKIYSDLDKQGDEFISKLEHIKSLIEKQKQTLQAYENQKEEAKEDIKEVEKEIEEVVQKIKTQEVAEKNSKGNELRTLQIKPKLDKLTQLENKHFKLDFTHEQEKAETESLKRKLNEMATNLAKRTPICNSCGQVIEGNKATEYKARIREQLKTKRTELTDRKSKDKDRAEELAQIQSSIEKLLKYREEHNKLQSILKLEKNNDQFLAELKSARLKLVGRLKDAKIRFKRAKKALRSFNTANLEEKQNRMKEQYLEIKKELKLHRWLIDDPLSNKGLKAFIFKAMLKSVNNQLKKYGKYLGYSIKFNVDLESANKNFEAIIYSGKNERPYNDLSGGQNQLVDVCLAFAVHDTVTEAKNINILLMDEVFESLDAENIELVSELIEIKSLKTSVHLISHQQNLVFSKVRNVTHLKLVDKVTAVV
jgi:DNA repair protein SbcC/Rad50